MTASSIAFHVRPAVRSDLAAITRFCSALWADESTTEHETHVDAILSRTPSSTLPLVLFVAEVDGTAAGFIEVGLRSHADGCDPSRAVGFVEGWYVEPRYQRRAVGKALMAAAEDWARSEGAREIASDTWFDNDGSQRAHEALGFAVVDRCVHYRKVL